MQLRSITIRLHPKTTTYNGNNTSNTIRTNEQYNKRYNYYDNDDYALYNGLCKPQRQNFISQYNPHARYHLKASYNQYNPGSLSPIAYPYRHILVAHPESHYHQTSSDLKPSRNTIRSHAISLKYTCNIIGTIENTYNYRNLLSNLRRIHRNNKSHELSLISIDNK